MQTTSNSSPGGPLMRDGIFERIRGDILSCVLQPGSEIHEQDLAQRYQVSKSPIRDALLRLREQCLVEVQPRKGYRVRPISVADALELYAMRELYERACAMGAIDGASDVQLAELDTFRAPPQSSRLPDWIAYNRRFHSAIAALCGNRRLASATTDLIEQFDRLTYVSVTGVGANNGLQHFVDEHAGIVDALQARDKRQAQTLVREHVESSRKRTVDAIANPVVVP